MATKRQTVQLKRVFLAAFRRHGNVSWACEEAAISSRTDIYRWKEQDENFLVAFEEAEIAATETLEHEAYRRAVEGTTKPIYQGGLHVGDVQEYSDVLLIFMLKARNPNKYRENVRVTLVTEDEIKRVAEDHGLEPLEVARLAEQIANGKA